MTVSPPDGSSFEFFSFRAIAVASLSRLLLLASALDWPNHRSTRLLGPVRTPMRTLKVIRTEQAVQSRANFVTGMVCTFRP